MFEEGGWLRSGLGMGPATLIMAIMLWLMMVSAGHAAFGVGTFDGQVTADPSGVALTQAGGHPYSFTTAIRFTTHTRLLPPFDLPADWPDEPIKDIVVDEPPGVVGSPTAAAQCTITQLAFDPEVTSGPACPSASQVGVATISQANPFRPVTPPIPLYNMVAPPDAPARFAMNVSGVIVTLEAVVRSGTDYGISVNLSNVSEGIALNGSDLTLWGVPADPSHDAERACPDQLFPSVGGPTCATDAPRKAFLRMPTSCSSDPSIGLETTMRTDSWFHPGTFQTARYLTHLPPNFPDPIGPQQGLTGCADVPFGPTFTVKPTDSTSPGASGYTFDLTLPQSDDPAAIGESDLRKAVVTLPEGVRVSPSEADGLGACSPAQIALKSAADGTCPDSSKLGTVKIDTPLLEKPLEGAIYLATPHNNPSNSLLSVYLVAKGSGVVIKLAGGVSPNAKNGQLAATFDNLPQTPFSNVHLEFFGGVRAPLTNPSRCGTYTTHAVLTSWSGKTVTSNSSFTTSHDGHGAPCPPPHFSPSFSAGTENPVAGASSPLSVTISRSDDDEEIASLDSVSMPQGLLARVKSVKLCKGVDARAGTCGAASQIGTVTAAAGPGPNPFAVKGRVYLGGRYKGGPFSLSIVVPVIAGPFDLGNVIVRSAILVDKHDATLKVVTDPLPTILQGIPLQVRLVHVAIDRSRFILNPTSCAEKQINASIRSTEGTVAHVHDRFQVGECASLRLAPKLTLRVGGKGHTHKGASTPLTTTLTMPSGGANLKSVSVSLPLALTSQLEVINNACTQAQFDTGHCEKARAGSAVAVTPLLAHALRGGAYFVKDPDQPTGSLPNLIVALRGQVDFDLVGKIKIPGGTRLATRFTAPDVPVTRFTLSLVSGSHGPLVAAENLCSSATKRARATLVLRGQNGKLVEMRQPLKVGGCRR